MGLILSHKPCWTFALYCLWNHISVTINRYWKTYVTGATVDYRRRVRCSMVYLPNMSLFSDLAFDFSLFPCFNFQLRQKYVSMPMTPYSITQNLFSLCPFKICMYQFDSHNKKSHKLHGSNHIEILFYSLQLFPFIYKLWDIYPSSHYFHKF